MTYDCFIFFNELDLLDLRLHTLDAVVDQFVLVEAKQTHAGREKQLTFYDNKVRFESFLPKLTHVAVGDMPDSGEDRWAREFHQRNAILRGLPGLRSDDFVLISDVDEIPHPDRVMGGAIGGYTQAMYNYYYNLRNTNEAWVGSVGVTGEELKRHTPQWFRDERYKLPRVQDGGWHFSWIGDAEAALTKLEAFAHSEFDNDSVKAKLAERIKARVDFAGRSPRQYAPEVLTEESFPPYLVEHTDKFSQHILD